MINGGENVDFVLRIGNRKIFLNHSFLVPTNHFARKCVPLFYIICVKSLLGLGVEDDIPQPKCDIWASLISSIWIFGMHS